VRWVIAYSIAAGAIVQAELVGQKPGHWSDRRLGHAQLVLELDAECEQIPV
jgi:hypothetical protein